MTPKQLRAAARLTILRQFGRAGLLLVLRRVRGARGHGSGHQNPRTAH